MFELNISLKSKNLKKAKIQEKFVEWGGELFSQDPPQYTYNNSLIFGEFLDNSYFKEYYGRLIGNDFDIDKYRTFRLLGEDLLEMERLVNISSPAIINNEVHKFIVSLSEISDFVIFLIRDEEEIDIKYQLHSGDELINIICSCMCWDSPKGALIVKS